MNRQRHAVFALSLIVAVGAAGSAWAVESISQLVREGTTAVAAATHAKAAQAGIQQRDAQLATESAQLNSDQHTLKGAVTAFQVQQNKVKDMMASYKTDCAGKTLAGDKYKACKERETSILSAASSVNAAQAPLVKQQDDFNARVTAFQAKLAQLKADAPATAANYEEALNDEQNWLNRARNLLLTPAVQRLARKAKCADFRAPPKGVDGLNQMGMDALACLKGIQAGS